MRTERIGFALCGSFCNHPKILMLFEEMAESFEMVPILSENTARYDTRFGLADDLIARVERAAGRPAIRTIVEAEPFGPQNLADVLVIAPCTGNTLAKLAHGVTDGPVMMAAKSHLRNGKPVVVALATNDGLSASAPNLAALLNRKNYYFVPFGQDDPQGKPTSLIADFSQLVPTIDAALRGVQLQPGDALIVHQKLKGAQLQRREQVVRHLGVLFHQRGAPPHGQVVVGAEVFFQQLAVDPGTARFVRPCRQLVTDGKQAFVQLHGDGDLPVGDAALVPYRHQRLGRRALRQFRFVQQDECSHRNPF